MTKNDISFLLESDTEPSDELKLLLPVGAGLDIPCGTYMKGIDGRWYLNGGLGLTTGIVGGPNTQKSGLANALMLAAADRVCQCHTTKIETYDTEVNMHQSRNISLSKRFKSFADGLIFKSGLWKVTDKSKLWGDEYFEVWKAYAKKKIDNRKKLLVDTPFKSDRHEGCIQVITPTFTIIDSVTEFEHSHAAKVQREVELGSKEALTVYMQLGLAKARMFSSMTTICENSGGYTLFTAHVGDEPPAIGRPSHLPPPKAMHTIKSGDKIKGTSGKFLFLMSNSYQITKVEWLYNSSSDRTPKFPMTADHNTVDLMKITLVVLRSKSGPSGVTIELLMSQQDGLQFDLTNFNNLKKNDFGMDGNARSYECTLLPGEKLSRTNIRQKLATNPTLCRAIEICAELKQILEFKAYTDDAQICSPAMLYKDLIDLGYDWDLILNKTRSWHTVNNENHELPTISTLTLMDMRTGAIVEPTLMKKK
jgi:hypothetical protein